MTSVITLLLLFVLINYAAYDAFRIDKERAKNGQWRISGARLLLVALAGGWFGAKLGQRRFRHKTGPRPFARLLNMVPLAWTATALLVFAVMASLPSASTVADAAGTEDFAPVQSSTP